ncbi:MAG: AlkZ family DNA glycosylase [Myxococcaceae bacterium]|nr:AlkZ family DNA glycosylase [Myxococcaceae bacterium]
MKATLAQRLSNQHLTRPLEGPVEVVRSLLAVQAQEYWGGLWAVGLRTRGATAASVEAALARGDILRSHPMRGTHHFVVRDDLRWLMELMGPLMLQRHGRRIRELGLDAKTLSKSMTLLQKALEGGRHLTRADVNALMLRNGIEPGFQRMPHIVYHAELQRLVCSGVRQGRHVTVALFDERVPKSAARTREWALAEMARRYFATRAPATIDDFAWWSQLPMGDVREAIALAGVDVDAVGPKAKGRAPRAFALPPYDEYTVAYRDRSAVGVVPEGKVKFAATTMLGPNLVLDGEVVGQWWRKGTKVTLEPWRKLPKADVAVVEAAAQRWAEFADAG